MNQKNLIRGRPKNRTETEYSRKEACKSPKGKSGINPLELDTGINESSYF
jgi:hypothetical protein